jgi:hypothetical protein
MSLCATCDHCGKTAEIDDPEYATMPDGWFSLRLAQHRDSCTAEGKEPVDVHLCSITCVDPAIVTALGMRYEQSPTRERRRRMRNP